MKDSTKESFGDLNELEKLGKNRKNSFTVEQLLDEKLKNKDGENRTEVTYRMEKSLNKILETNVGKKIAIISHGASIKFLLYKWCNLNENNELIYNNEVISVNSPGIIKLVFNKKELIKLKQIL